MKIAVDLHPSNVFIFSCSRVDVFLHVGGYHLIAGGDRNIGQELVNLMWWWTWSPLPGTTSQHSAIVFSYKQPPQQISKRFVFNFILLFINLFY